MSNVAHGTCRNVREQKFHANFTFGNESSRVRKFHKSKPLSVPPFILNQQKAYLELIFFPAISAKNVVIRISYDRKNKGASLKHGVVPVTLWQEERKVKGMSDERQNRPILSADKIAQQKSVVCHAKIARRQNRPILSAKTEHVLSSTILSADIFVYQTTNFVYVAMVIVYNER